MLFSSLVSCTTVAMGAPPAAALRCGGGRKPRAGPQPSARTEAARTNRACIEDLFILRLGRPSAMCYLSLFCLCGFGMVGKGWGVDNVGV